MKKTIGILGGMGPMATADLLIKITSMTKADCDNDHIRVYVDCDCAIPDRTGAILHGGPDPVPEMSGALRNLDACGADCVVMACNTAHYFLPRLQAMTDTPILDMMSITARRCAELFPGKTAAILGIGETMSRFREGVPARIVPGRKGISGWRSGMHMTRNGTGWAEERSCAAGRYRRACSISWRTCS